ncbi:hypothetical protein SUDANB6_00179 [Streptomyces sp. enrichment culture]
MAGTGCPGRGRRPEPERPAPAGGGRSRVRPSSHGGARRKDSAAALRSAPGADSRRSPAGDPAIGRAARLTAADGTKREITSRPKRCVVRGVRRPLRPAPRRPPRQADSRVRVDALPENTIDSFRTGVIKSGRPWKTPPGRRAGHRRVRRRMPPPPTPRCDGPRPARRMRGRPLPRNRETPAHNHHVSCPADPEFLPALRPRRPPARACAPRAFRAARRRSPSCAVPPRPRWRRDRRRGWRRPGARARAGRGPDRSGCSRRP